MSRLARAPVVILRTGCSLCRLRKRGIRQPREYIHCCVGGGQPIWHTRCSARRCCFATTADFVDPTDTGRPRGPPLPETLTQARANNYSPLHKPQRFLHCRPECMEVMHWPTPVADLELFCACNGAVQVVSGGAHDGFDQTRGALRQQRGNGRG